MSFRFASAPSLIQFAEGRLLLVFESYTRKARRDFGRLGYAISTDAGKSWSDAKPLTIRGLRRRMGRPRGPALLKDKEDRLNLFFICEGRRGRRELFIAKTRIRTHETKDSKKTDTQKAEAHKEVKHEVECVLRGKIQQRDKNLTLADICVANIDGRVHLYGTIRSDDESFYHGILSDSLALRREYILNVDRMGTAGTILQDGGSYRLYASDAKGIISSASADGNGWIRDPGLRLADASDPAVTRLPGGTYLMVYVERSRSEIGDDRLSTEGGEVSAAGEANNLDEWYASLSDGEVSEATDPAAEGLLDQTLQSDRPIDDDELEPEPIEEAIAKDDVSEADVLEEISGESDEEIEAEEAVDGDELQYTDDGIPIPDFKNKVDYREWLEDCYDPDSVTANAYDAYVAMMPMLKNDQPDDKPQWPEFNSMFHDAGRVGPPEPWDPADRPDWEATFIASAELETLYAEAASVEDYVPRLLFPQADSKNEKHDRDSENLLLNILLPSLSGHRAMTKQILGDAWRAPDGKLDPQRMLDAFDTTLSSAEHLSHGDFLIETLVSVAQKNMIEKNARWALKNNVFSADEMESALDIFIEKDQHLPDPAQMLAGEFAWAMDYTQYVFGPIEPNRKPTLNAARAAYITGMASDPPPTEEQIASSDPHQAVESFIDYYDNVADLMRRGYPEVKSEDFTKIEEAATRDNYVVRSMLPHLSRVHQLVNRQEASRRATQLTYAIHLHKARTGQWPTSLDDLPPRYTQEARTDPFSGQDFVYRVTENGPLLYSTSENGVDDGGDHHRRWGDRKQDEDEGDDHVFWPPPPRR